MTNIISLKKAVLSVAVLTFGLAVASPTNAQLIPEGPTGPGAPAKVAPAANIVCKITELKMEHGVTLNNQKGIKFHFKIEIDNAKGQQVQPMVFFLNKNDKALKAIDTKYGNALGEMVTFNQFSPMYDQTDYTGWVFMPYSAIAPQDTPAGKYPIKVLASVYHVEGNKFVCDPVKNEFSLDIGAAPAKNDGGLVK